MRKQLLSYLDAVETPVQHTRPCSDCPFARTSLPGWLADSTPDEWLQMAHGETKIECHTKIPHQCAGSAIYRKNVLKSPRDKSILMLPADRKAVFATPVEFKAHHEG